MFKKVSFLKFPMFKKVSFLKLGGRDVRDGRAQTFFSA